MTVSNMETAESRLIAEALAAVLEQSKKTAFDAAPYERATELLESLPPVQFVDARVRLALQVGRGTVDLIRPDIARRALYAAFPAGTNLKDKLLERRWLTGAGLVEAAAGNVQLALKYKVLSFELSKELNDPLGLAAEWNNLAFMVAGAGLYEDAIQYATVAMKVEGVRIEELPERYGPACINRANALIRLGRFTEAISDIAGALASITPPASGMTLGRLIMGKQLYCEIALARGDLGAARTAFQAAAAWAERCGIPRLELQIERLRALLSVRDCGVQTVVAKLESLLQQAIAIELKQGESTFDDFVFDVLHSLEQVCREHNDVSNADKWLGDIGLRMRQNAARMISAMSANAFISGTDAVESKMAEVDRYLHSKSILSNTKQPSLSHAWSYLVGLAAAATGIEDPTKEHGVRVARLTALVARELGLSGEVQQGIEAGCLVHDIGKVGVPSSVLLKTRALEAGEQQLYDAHPAAGIDLIERATLPNSKIVQNVVRFHHHSYAGDTAGSPLRGEAIPIEARIASVCDEYDSLVTGRPRRPPISSHDALREIFEQRSQKFDPTVVDVFVELCAAYCERIPTFRPISQKRPIAWSTLRCSACSKELRSGR